MRLLLVEDSLRLQDSLSAGLRRCGYAVDIAGNGESGLRYARHNEYDVIVLDLMIPKIDGLTVLSSLREEGSTTHVLILTARDTIDDRVRGLRAGADDYLVKPFSFDELVARIEALSRRRYGVKNPVIEVADLVVDTGARRATRGGQVLDLAPREYALLEFLAYRAGEVVTRRDLEDHLYGERNFPMSNAVDRAVCTLRAKLKINGSSELIRTRRGVGYVLEEAGSS